MACSIFDGFTDQLNCKMTILSCGNSLLEVLADVWVWYEKLSDEMTVMAFLL